MADQPIGPGTLLAGRFTLEDLLEETEGARFWRATDRTLARNVAVHVIAASDPRANALLNAARSSATVTDGRLLRVLDAAIEDDVVYVVNEWGSGVSLDRMLAEGPLSARRAAWVVKEVADAISTAHRHGVAHGHLHPENVMVTEAGSVKLIGFVIDAVLHGGRQVHNGTPMSDHESDVLNLGALLYASLTGKWPGTAGCSLPPAPLEHGHPLRPRQVRAGVPRPLDAVCERVLNPNGHHHTLPMETAHEVFAALSDYIGDPTGTGQMGYVGAPLGGDTQGTDDGPAGDPEATQAGTPVFYDEGAGVGWTSPDDSRGLRRDEDPEHAADFEPRRTPPPPPPVLPEPEPKPLFAPDKPGTTRHRDAPDESERTAVVPGLRTGAVSRAASPGPRNGSLPSAWGPDASSDDDGSGGYAAGGYDAASWGGDEEPGKSWLRLAVLIGGVIVLVVAIIFAFNLGKGSSPDTTSTGGGGGGGSQGGNAPAAAHPLRIAGVTDFDPEGDPPEENPSEAPLAVDGNPATAWSTMTYYGNPRLGGLKSGVGLVVDLGKPQKLGSVQLTLGGSPTSVEILGAPGSTTAPTSTSGLKTLASADGAGTTADLTLKAPVTTRYFVVWLTSLPQGAGGYQGHVAEIVPKS
ncbi:MAG: protein kinase family protein [Nocardioidaceae bacterium]